MTVSGYFLCQRPKLTAVSAELDVFMNDLTVESIDPASKMASNLVQRFLAISILVVLSSPAPEFTD